MRKSFDSVYIHSILSLPSLATQSYSSNQMEGDTARDFISVVSSALLPRAPFTNMN